MPDPSYREVVRAARWFTVALAVLSVTPVIGIIAVLRDESLSSGGRVTSVVALAASGVLMVLVVLWVCAMTVEVSATRLRFRFGPFGRTLAAGDLATASAERYQWVRFGGWGWRFGWLDRKSTRLNSSH